MQDLLRGNNEHNRQQYCPEKSPQPQAKLLYELQRELERYILQSGIYLDKSKKVCFKQIQEQPKT